MIAEHVLLVHFSICLVSQTTFVRSTFNLKLFILLKYPAEIIERQIMTSPADGLGSSDARVQYLGPHPGVDILIFCSPGGMLAYPKISFNKVIPNT